jgi:drug/metabolite transporter (DMT)-like permease
MLSPNFFLFVGIAILSYGLQAPLLAYFTRQYDSLIVVVYRNIFLAIIMLPVFFFVTREDIVAVALHLPLLITAAFFGTVALVSNLTAFRYMPVALANILRQVSDVTLAITIGTIFLHEYLTATQLFLLGVIVACGALLALTRALQTDVDLRCKKRGLLLAVFAGFMHALSFFFFTNLVRESEPLVAAYFWEAGIGIFAALYLLGSLLYKPEPVKLTLRKALPIGFASVVTISGTLAYGYAVEYGPYALATGLITSSVVVVLLTSRLFLKEKLAFKQIALMLTIVAFMIMLRISS